MVSSSGMDGENLDGDQEALELADTPPLPNHQSCLVLRAFPASITQSK